MNATIESVLEAAEIEATPLFRMKRRAIATG